MTLLSVTKSPTGWCVGGELDAYSGAVLARTFSGVAEMPIGQIDLDVGDVAFIDASGLGALVDLHTRASAVGKAVVLRNPSPAVRRLLAITELGELFAIGTNGVDRHDIDS
jgi:anti-anti-sigma factor